MKSKYECLKYEFNASGLFVYLEYILYNKELFNEYIICTQTHTQFSNQSLIQIFNVKCMPIKIALAQTLICTHLQMLFEFFFSLAVAQKETWTKVHISTPLLP